MWTLSRCILVLFAVSVAARSLPGKRQTCSNPVRRRSWTALSNEDKMAYIDAVQCLARTPPQAGIAGARNLWDEIQFAHIRNQNFIHGVAAFLPWHRYYIKAFETLASRHCGYNAGLPYWDEAADASNMAASAVWDNTYGMGGNGDGSKGCITSGPFQNFSMVYNDSFQAAEPYCISRSFNQEEFSGASQSNVDECFNEGNWASASSCYENWVHLAGHNGVGRVMANALLAPADPVFFLHHTNLDRLWWSWQQADLSTRLTEMGRPNTPGEDFNVQNGWQTPGPEFTQYCGDDGPITTLKHVLFMAGIVPNATIADVMDLRSPAMCAEYA
ncbi:hypothetical protein AC578_3684 [Pseudocercospora eumusae]|uniref:Tyrosinase copper-binding domain-containing protein n=1 Tax=Pseudocercospora eumusae TaxID=321146 RepID=A0A139HSY9_9PEZI|nr:hypothetical protein AC578_3684 [Pseudocercospora eumusae]